MFSKFEETLELTADGPVGAGPIDDGAALVSLRVWIVQNNRSAAAAGRTPFGEAPLQGTWRIATKLEPESGHFAAGDSAHAFALAVVKTPEGETKVEQWDQMVTLRAPEPPPAEPPPAA